MVRKRGKERKSLLDRYIDNTLFSDDSDILLSIHESDEIERIYPLERNHFNGLQNIVLHRQSSIMQLKWVLDEEDKGEFCKRI